MPQGNTYNNTNTPNDAAEYLLFQTGESTKNVRHDKLRDAINPQYATVAALTGDADITKVPTGAVVTLKGYYAAGDFGEPIELIVEAAAGGVLSHTLDDGRYANMYRDNVSVLHFGATGDGVTDDTTALQAALSSTAPHIIFPNLPFSTAGLSSTLDGRTIELRGTLVKNDTAVTSFFSITGTENVIFGGGNINCSKAAQSGAVSLINHEGLYADGADNLVIRNISLQDSYGPGIWVTDSTNVLIEKCTVTGCKSRSITLNGAFSDSTIRGCFTDSAINCMSSGDFARNTLLEANRIDFTSTSYDTGGHDSSFYTGITLRCPVGTVANNIVYCAELASSMGISCDRTMGIIITGNKIFSATFASVEITASEAMFTPTPITYADEDHGAFTIVANNEFINSSGHPGSSGLNRGVTSSGFYTKNVIIEGNVFINCGVFTRGSSLAATVDANWFTNWQISGNVFRADTAEDQYPIDLEKCYQVKIDGNLWDKETDNTTYSLVLLRDDCQDISVTNNKITNGCRAFVLTSADITDITIVGNECRGTNWNRSLDGTGSPTFSGKIDIRNNLVPDKTGGSAIELSTYRAQNGDFTFVSTGTGADSAWGTMFNLNTGTTASSTELAHLTSGVLSIQSDERPDRINWTELMLFGISITDNAVGATYDAGSGHIGRVIIGQTYNDTTGAILTSSKSVGLELRGREVYGFLCDGTAVTYTVNPLVTFTNTGEGNRFLIWKMPGGNVIFEHNGVFKETITDSGLVSFGSINDVGITCFVQNGSQASSNQLRVENIFGMEVI